MLKLFIHTRTHAHTHTHTHSDTRTYNTHGSDLKLTISDEWTHVDGRRNGGDKSPAMPLPHERCRKIFGALRGHQQPRVGGRGWCGQRLSLE